MGTCLGFAGDLEVYAGPLSSEHATVVLFNRSPVGANMTVVFNDLEAYGIFGAKTARVRDLWAATDLGSFSGSFTAFVQPHGVVHVNLAPLSEE